MPARTRSSSGASRRRFSVCPHARGASGCVPTGPPRVPARTRRSSGVFRRCIRACPLARGAPGRRLRGLPCVPARTRRTLLWPEGDCLCARTHAVPLGVFWRGFQACPLARVVCLVVLSESARACPLARGAPGRNLKGLPCVPARTRRTLLGLEGGSLGGRAHAAPRCVCVCVCSTSFRVCPLARGAGLVVSAGTSDVPARTWRAWARVEGAPVRARSRADLSWCVPKAARCVHARGALWRIPKLVREARPRASQSRILRLAGGRWAGISWRLWRTFKKKTRL